ncbi:MAG: AAA family ATPase [Caulobacteraceae bacterium]|nr:AAA family ATPase [Caulobacteraceae bacterium]
MSRSDLLIKLVEAGSQNDQKMLERTVQALVAEARAKQHHTLADRLSGVWDQGQVNRTPRAVGGTLVPEKVRDLVTERPARRSLDDMVLTPEVGGEIRDLLDEQQQAALLQSHSLEPRSRVMLVGPPGNGKTTLAEAIAYELALPFFVARYDSLVGSYLGETATRLKRVFDFARSTPCVLFLDEFDAIGKERGDKHETGEIKRVVSSLLMQIDDLPSYTVLVCATNHPELLDRAVWRRFQIRVDLEAPTPKILKDWLTPFSKEVGVPATRLTSLLVGASYAEIEEFVTTVRRKVILLHNSRSSSDIVADVSRSWRSRLGGPPGSKVKPNGSGQSDRTLGPTRSRSKD